MRKITFICDICDTPINGPHGELKVDFRNKPANSGGSIAPTFHACGECRTKLIYAQKKVYDLVINYVKSLKDKTIDEVKNGN